MKLPKRKYSATQDYNKASKLLQKLFSLKLVRIIVLVLFGVILIPIFFICVFRPTIQEEVNYGVTFSNKYAEEIGLDWKDAYIKILDDLGAKNLRLIAYWDDIENERDVYDYSDIKWQLDEARNRDINVILVMGRKVPRWPECFEPMWWKDIEEEGIQNTELFEYIKTTTNELKEYENIIMWQVENEPFFKFGQCPIMKTPTVKNEINVVREIDDRPVLIQDSGEGGLWFLSYKLGDNLGISMYRKIWFDFWGVIFGKSVYFKYPLAHWTYKIKSEIVRVPYEDIIITELQAEPWGPKINSELTEKEKNRTMSRNDFLDTISYAQKAGFKNYYLWGVEWWLWEKEMNNNSFYWDTAKAVFK